MVGSQYVCLAQIGAAHGVRGEVKVISFTSDPLGFAGYGPLLAVDGRSFAILNVRIQGKAIIVQFSGVESREQAEGLKGVQLFMERSNLPDITEDEDYYHADLIGLDAVTEAGEMIGKVLAVHNFGAGDILEISTPHNNPILLPFSNSFVPVVDIAEGRVVVVLPGED